MPKYSVQKDGFILGNHYAKGDTIELSGPQAKYLLPPMGDVLKLAGAKKPVSKPASTKDASNQA